MEAASTSSWKEKTISEKIVRDTEKSTEKSVCPKSTDENSTIVEYTDEEILEFKENLVAANTKKSTTTSVRRFQSWYREKYKKEVDLNQISKKEAPYLLKHFFLEIRQTTKDNKGKEYEPGSLQTYRNGLRRFFLERPCPPSPDNFDIDKEADVEFEEVATMLSMKKKDLKKKGLGTKPNAARSLEENEVEKMWSSGALGLHTSRSLLHLVWWNNVTHLGMRAFQEQCDCTIDDFTITEYFIEYKKRQTKNRQGDENSRKRTRKYNNKIWRTNGGERDPYRAFVEYLEHRPKGEQVPRNLFLSPIDKPTSEVWYKMSPVGINTLSKMMKKIADIASLEGKCTNSCGRKTAIQALREDFDPLEISELTGHANPESISSYSHNPLEKQRKMSHKLAGFSPCSQSSSTVSTSVVESSRSLARNTLNEISANVEGRQANQTSKAAEAPYNGLELSGAVSGLFTGVTFNNSPVNISINLQASVHR